MNEDDLRKKIYEYLGLEIGSLTSESGNDWQIAKKEVLSNYKKETTNENDETAKTDYRLINKNDEFFKFALESTLAETERYKSVIAMRSDLIDSEINQLIHSGSKETIMNLIRFQKLSSEHIDKLISNSVYLAKKLLIENQELSELQKTALTSSMEKFPDLYKNILLDFK